MCEPEFWFLNLWFGIAVLIANLQNTAILHNWKCRHPSIIVKVEEIEEIIEMKITHKKNIERRKEKFG